MSQSPKLNEGDAHGAYTLDADASQLGRRRGPQRAQLGFKRREFAHLPNRPGTVLASWMSVTPQVHDLAIVANGLNKTAQLHHIAFNLQDFSDVLTAADTLRDVLKDASKSVQPAIAICRLACTCMHMQGEPPPHETKGGGLMANIAW